MKLQNVQDRLNESQNNEEIVTRENKTLKETNEALMKDSAMAKRYERLLAQQKKMNDLSLEEKRVIRKENMILRNKMYVLSERVESIEDQEKLYTKAMSRVQQQSAMANYMLGKKFDLISDNLETREMQMLCLVSGLKNDSASSESIEIAKEHIQVKSPSGATNLPLLENNAEKE
ncbi:hypothetical protein Ciccas_001574 [Cichlidogyrus casuarinus]|uniref:Uncharacterized protein n=1 Tax=Cichlidogyrus casuarinus TaxID=1844966 RepID=A0ABD2QK60_9PLAT